MYINWAELPRFIEGLFIIVIIGGVYLTITNKLNL